MIVIPVVDILGLTLANPLHETKHDLKDETV